LTKKKKLQVLDVKTKVVKTRSDRPVRPRTGPSSCPIDTVNRWRNPKTGHEPGETGKIDGLDGFAGRTGFFISFHHIRNLH